ncbi:hypothetical protein IIA79_02940 [bacterium]|nr:hypothetical protein [bacterium]
MLLAMRELARLLMHDGGQWSGLQPAADTSQDEMAGLALRIGSDAPFFLRGGCCEVEGIGETLSAIERKLPFHLVLAVPEFSAPTGPAYAALDRGTEPLAPLSVPHVARGLQAADWTAVRFNLVNDFQGQLIARRPECRDYLNLLESSAAIATSITGSGSGFYGLFDNREDAAKAKEALSTHGQFRYLGLHRPIGH